MTPGWLPELPAVHWREDPSAVARALAALGVTPPRSFVAFHERYRGVFGVDGYGIELLDLAEGEPDYPPTTTYPSVVRATWDCRELFGTPDRFVVISQYFCNGVLMYDTEADLVYDVDFEGGHDELVRGELEPDQLSFEAFLRDYFRERDGW